MNLALLTLVLFAGCASKPIVKTLVTADGKDEVVRLAAGRELVFFENVEGGWELAFQGLDGPISATLTWDGEDKSPDHVALSTQTAQRVFSRSGLVRISLKADTEVSFSNVTLRGARQELVTPKASSQKANVVIYLVDTLRRDAVGVYGGPPDLTPHLDKFAAESTVFAQLTASSGWTKPSLASMFTGAYPRAHGANTPTAQMRPEFPTLAELLAQRGYDTAGFTPNPTVDEKFGFRRGFAEWSNRYHERSEQIHARALKWLDGRDSSRPFFLFVHSIDPHDPYFAPAEFRARLAPDVEVGKYFQMEETPQDPSSAWAIKLDKLQEFLHRPALATEKDALDLRKLYNAEVAYNDATFGQFVAELKARGLYDDSLIVVVSDHGEEFREHGGWLHGGQMYQELIGLPLMVRFPGPSAPERRSTPVGHVDIFPTVLNFAGGAVSSQGQDLRTEGPQRAMQSLALPPGAITEALVDGGWKMIRTRFQDGRSSLQLFDLQSDPKETANLAATREIRSSYMQAYLDGLGPVASGEPAELNKELQKGLRSLNYLNPHDSSPRP